MKHKNLINFIAVLTLAFSAAHSNSQVTASEASNVGMTQLSAVAPGVVLVGLKPGVAVSMGSPGLQVSDTSLNAAFANIGVKSIEPIFPHLTRPLAVATTGGEIDLGSIYRLRLLPGADVMQSVERLKRDPSVAFAEPDYQAKALAVPNDPSFPDQWGLAKIHAPAAWDVTKGDTRSVIAILDSGIDLNHQDLAGQLWTNPQEIPGNGLDDDQDGLVDDVHGWNFLVADNNLSDDNGHGTQVAGVAGAATNNGLGVAGTCWSCRLMVVKVMQSTGIVNYSDIAAGIAYAAGKGANVINLSLGGYADSETLRTAIESAATTAVIVAGAGNDNRSAPFYPAAYPQVVAVAATDQNDIKADFSNYGNWVDLTAPGVAIKTTFAGNNAYGEEKGTSLSAPFVAGTAGLISSQHPDWSPAMVRQQVLNTTASLAAANPGYHGQLGSGRLDAGAALSTTPQARLALASWALDGQASARPTPGQSYDLVLTLENSWLPARSLTGVLSENDAYVTVSDASGTFGDINTGQSGDNSANEYRISLTANAPYNHPISFHLQLSGADGYAFGLDFTLTVRSGLETIPGGTQYQADTIWTKDKTYMLQGNLIVEPGVTLTVQPGTQVYIKPASWLRIDGTLVADGTASEPILFTTNSITNTQWAGIRFTDSSEAAIFDADGNYLSGSILRYVELSYAQTGVSMLSRAPFIANSKFAYNGYSIYPLMGNGIAISTGSSSAKIVENLFEKNGGGIEIGGGAPQILENSFTGHSDAVLNGGGSPSIISNTLTQNDGGAVHLGCCNSNNLVLRGNVITNNSNGVWLNVLQEVGIEHNLIANNRGDGLYMNVNQASANSVRFNTIIHNQGHGLTITGPAAGQVSIDHNNWFDNKNYDVYIGASQEVAVEGTVNAAYNYWGEIASSAIPTRIYDCNDAEFGCGSAQTNFGEVVWQPPLPAPDQVAPAYVHSASVSPNPVGIERATFEVDFSKPMITQTLPALSFHDTRRGTLEEIDLMKAVSVYIMAEDSLGRMWFSGNVNGGYRYDGKDWVQFTTANSGLGSDAISTIFGASNGDVWFGHIDGRASQLQGDHWIIYSYGTTGVRAQTFGEDLQGKIWLGGVDGVSSFDGVNWKHYTQQDGLAGKDVSRIARDGQGRMWFATDQGLSAFDGNSWQTYDESNGMPSKSISSMFYDGQGYMWVGFGWSQNTQDQKYFLGMFDGSHWTFYGPGNTNGLITGCGVTQITEDSQSNMLFFTSCSEAVRFDGQDWTRFDYNDQIAWMMAPVAHYDAMDNLWLTDDGHLKVLWGWLDYPVVDSLEWLSPTRLRATYNFTPLVPQRDYALLVSAANGLDDMPVAADDSGRFTVAYAGYASDDTPPSRPAVIALNDGSLTTLAIQWSSDDPQGIAQYRYAIGTTTGGRDVLDWKYVPAGTTSLTLNGLLLTRGQTYYVSVAAQNSSGLWSQVGVSNPVVAGTKTVIKLKVYLPLTVGH